LRAGARCEVREGMSSFNSVEEICAAARVAIEKAVPGARAEVTPASPGHFEIVVTAKAFEGRSRVQQQQVVYGAIADRMRGDAPPIHAVDRLRTVVGE
jgi:acid stress-induced BolA-like protein IbaG/YrbA